MLNFRRSWLLCGAVLVVITSCSSTVASKTYRVGDVGPAGGRVFITPSTVGNSTGLYFEVAPLESEVRRGWASEEFEDLSVAGAGGLAIGDGAANTAAIASLEGKVSYSAAAVYASDYSVNGFSDWFLPSKDELNEVYEISDSVGLFSSDQYWSSSEIDASLAWAQFFGGGFQFKPSKANPFYVRPVRAFP